MGDMENLLEEYSREYEILKEDVDKGQRTYKIRGVMSRAGVKNKNGRIYPYEVMRESVDSVQDYIKNNRFLGELDHPCLTDHNFDVLTESGWKHFDDLEIGENVLTFNESNLIEYKPILEKINQPYKGEVYHFKGRNIDSTFTGPHRFYLEDRNGNREIATAEEIYNNRKKFNKHKIIKVGEWNGENKETLKIGETEVPAKPFMAFMGFFLSEGHTNPKPNGVGITQNEGLNADEFRDILSQLPFEYRETYKKRPNNVSITFHIHDKDLYEYLKPLGDCYTKYIPHELKQLSPQLLEELIEWFINGDGRDHRGKYGGNRTNVFSVSKRLIEDLHELVIKTGGSGNWTEIDTTEDYIFADHLIEAKNKTTLYQLNISTTKGIYLDDRFLKIEKKEHDGNIYSIHVKDNENFYMKQNNKAFLTGNSTPKINMDKVSHKIIELHMADDGAVLGEMIPAGPYKDKLISLIEDQIGFGVSTRGTGSTKSSSLGEGIVEVQRGYKLRGIDVVHDPSAGVFPSVVKEDTENIFSVPSKFKDIWEDVFNK